MKTALRVLCLLIALAAADALFWSWVYRAPRRSFPGYLFFIPRVMDMKEAAFRLGLKQVPPGDKAKYQERLRSKPDDAEAAFILGYIAYRERNPKEAVDNFLLASRGGFDQPKLHYWLARAYGELGWRDKAIAEYKKALMKLSYADSFRLSLQLDYP